MDDILSVARQHTNAFRAITQHLERALPPVTFSAAQLASEESRLQLAEANGVRVLVQSMRDALTTVEQEQEAQNGRNL